MLIFIYSQQRTNIQARFETVTLRNGTRVERISQVKAVIRRENIRPRGAEPQSWTKTNPTDLYIYNVLDGDRERDERGHLIAGSLGGSGTDRNNIVPMSKNLNNKDYKSLESEVITEIQYLEEKYKKAATAFVTIDVTYPSGDTARPSNFRYLVDYKVDGVTPHNKGGLFHNQ